MVHRTRVQSRKGPIDVMIQLIDPDGGDAMDSADVIDVSAAAVLHGNERHTDSQISDRASADALDFAPVGGGVAKSGMTLGRYILDRKLGEGTFGVVFAARDTNLDREVAIKVLHPDHVSNVQIRRRFLEEGKATARIDHPAIVTVFDGGFEAGCAYLAMELLRGEPLTARLTRSGRLSPDAAMEVARQLAAALDAAHQAGVIHRDLKPDNIFLVPDPAAATGERVKVLDFGLAKLGRTQEHTAAKLVFGTPRYMSPEQTRSAATVDARSDIYALGCILFELVCGVPPFDGDVLDVVRAHQQIRAPRAGAVVRGLPEQLDKLITTMLEKAPERRPQTMAAVLRALEAGGAMVPGVAATMAPTTAAAMAAMAARPTSQPKQPLQIAAAATAAVKSFPMASPKPSVRPSDAWPLPPSRAARGTPSLPLPGVAPASPLRVAGSNSQLPAVQLFPDTGPQAALPPVDHAHVELNETVQHHVFDYAELTGDQPQLDDVEITVEPAEPEPVLHAPASRSVIASSPTLFAVAPQPFAAGLLAAHHQRSGRSGMFAVLALIALILALLATLAWHIHGSGTAVQDPVGMTEG
jgi:serine/threonine protein kinase|nr:protein kinase [Kofleriaceae bacterium]